MQVRADVNTGVITTWECSARGTAIGGLGEQRCVVWDGVVVHVGSLSGLSLWSFDVFSSPTEQPAPESLPSPAIEVGGQTLCVVLCSQELFLELVGPLSLLRQIP